jgi:RNA-splicing ligase RtcB
MMNLKIFTTDIEDKAREQIDRIQSHPAFQDAKIRIMPDVHFGAGCVIGFTSTLTDLVVPNIIGVDIGCGVRAVHIGHKDWVLKHMEEHLSGLKCESDLYADLDAFIRKNIPCSCKVREIPKTFGMEWDDISKVADFTHQDKSYVFRSLGTLGGGNHFIELGIAENDHYWIIVHSGSRNFGKKIADFYQALSTVPEGFTQQEGYLEGYKKNEYLFSMDVAQRYAAFNRELITNDIMTLFFHQNRLGQGVVESTHNYINFNDDIIRKGAISAHKGQDVIIPWNMRDGIIIGTGKGNEDWNCSAPHGAGRVMGRNQAFKNLSVAEFKDTMKDVWSTCVGEDTLDESPMVYKDCRKIEALLGDTIEVVHRLKPVYNFKAEDRRKRKKKQ